LDKNEPDNVSSPTGTKRRVTFQSENESNLTHKSSTKLRRRRSFITTRSLDERISFTGRNTIYTAGISLLIN
jgi:hypothetical protein